MCMALHDVKYDKSSWTDGLYWADCEPFSNEKFPGSVNEEVVYNEKQAKSLWDRSEAILESTSI